MMQEHFAEELQKEFERKLGRLLTTDEKALIEWMAVRQDEEDRAQSEMIEAES